MDPFKLQLIYHKIGEKLIIKKDFGYQNKQFVKIHIEIDFIPYLRDIDIDYENSIEQLKKDHLDEIENLKKEHKKQLSSKDKEIKQHKTKADQIQQANNSLNQKLKKSEMALNQLQKKFNEYSQKSSIKDMKIFDLDSIKEYEKIEEIDSGRSGVVFKVARKTLYALKEMKTKNIASDEIHSKMKQFIKEYEIMNLLDHPNILKAFGIFFNDEKNSPSILFEYCSENLNIAIKNRTFSKIKIICCIYQIVGGMKYVHFQKVVHRYLKPSNILIAIDGTIKIGDFGISKLMLVEEQTSMTGGVGTLRFMAPEIINGENNYTEKVDVFSFGVLTYFILNNGDISKIKIGDIFNGKKIEFPASFTIFAKKLIGDCLSATPESRPSFIQISEDLEKNKYKLLSLKESEISQINSFIKEHKRKIPAF